MVFFTFLKKFGIVFMLIRKVYYSLALLHCIIYSLPRSDKVPEDYKELAFVCLRPDGAYESVSTVGIMCKRASKKLEGLEGFHFHQLRHTFTTNLISNGAAIKDVQELLGHADANTTMSIYAHSTREAKRTSARLLDKVSSG